MNLLTVIDRLYGSALVTLEPALCRNARTTQGGCAACADACPAGAIAMAAGAPELDPLACKGCGVCVPVCPTGAVASRESAGLLPSLGDGPLAMVACAAVSGSEVTVPCLAALDAETVAAAAVGRTLVLTAPEEAACGACPVGGHPRLNRLVLQAEQVLQAFGLSGRIRLAYGEEARAEANQMDRRQFLSLGRLGFLSAASALVKPEPRQVVLQELPTRAPAPRRRLVEAVRRQEASLPEGAAAVAGHFSGVTAAAAGCDGCEACIRVCPTGALMLQPAAAHSDHLQFTAESCMACGLCMDACPKGVLQLMDTFSPRAVATGQSETLAVLPVALCSRCGQRFHGREQFCPACRKVGWLTEAVLALRPISS